MKAILATHATAWLRVVAEHARESDAILFSSLAYGVGASLRDAMIGHPPELLQQRAAYTGCT